MKINSFDDYIAEEVRKDPSLIKGLEEAGKIIDVSFQIYAIRKQRGFTQAQLAKKAGMHQSNIARLEDASLAHVPSTRTLGKIAKALDVDITTLFTPPYKEEKAQQVEYNKIKYSGTREDKTEKTEFFPLDYKVILVHGFKQNKNYIDYYPKS